MEWVWTISWILGLLSLLWLLVSYRHVGFHDKNLLGHLPGLLKNAERFEEWATQLIMDSPTHTITIDILGGIHMILTANPANVEHLLKTKFHNYPKGETFHVFLEDFLGKGIFNVDGEQWKLQRKIASHEFNTSSLRDFIEEEVQWEIKERLLPLLREASESKRVVDLQDVLKRFAFDNICKVAFGVDPKCLDLSLADSVFAVAFDTSTAISASRYRVPLQAIWKFKRFFNLGSEKKLKESIFVTKRFADDVIRYRKIRDEIAHVINKRNYSSEVFSYEELKEMQYLHASLSESMRLYPPVPFDSKTAVSDDVLPDGTVVKKGFMVAYAPYAMGRCESVWGKDCLEFRPERWLKARQDGSCVFVAENLFKYPVFQAGPRICLGKEMAFIQMKSIVASVVGRFEFVVAKDFSPRMSFALTLAMKDPFPVRVTEI